MIDSLENYYKYKLSADPFRLSPDHRFAFSHPSYAKARAYIEFAIRRGEGFITITGGPGTGKTTLINEIMNGVRDNGVLMAMLNSTQLESRDLLHMVAAAFGLRYGDVSKATLLLGLEQFLTQQQRNNKRAVLVVDEAQGLSTGAIEELRLLANLQSRSRLLLQVILVGQEQLRELVKSPAMEHLSQRIIVASHLDPLSLPETVTYVEHRLTKVRWQGDPAITEDALRLIHRFSGGVPRRINLICSRLFLFGGLEGKHELTGEDAQTVIADLQHESLLPREAPAGVEGAAQSDPEGLPLSLPRESAVAEDRRAANRAVGATQGGEARELAEDTMTLQMPASRRAEPQDIPSPKAPLREALGQVCSTLDSTVHDRPAPVRRRPPAAEISTGAEARQGSPQPPRGVLRAEPEDQTVPRPGKRRPAVPAEAPGKRRNFVSVLAVVVGLALAFGLMKLHRDDPPPGSAVMTAPVLSEPAAPAEQSIAERDARAVAPADEAAAPGSGAGDALPTETPSEPATDAAETAPTSSGDADRAPGEAPSPEPELASGPAIGNGIKESADAGSDNSPALSVAPKSGVAERRSEPAATNATAGKPQEATSTEAAPPAAAQAAQPAPAAAPRVRQPETAPPPADGGAAETTASTGPSRAEVDAQMTRLAQAAQERLNRGLERTETAPEARAAAEPAPVVPPAPEKTPPSQPQAAPPPAAPAASRPKTAAVAPVAQPSAPKIAVAPPAKFGAAAPAVTPAGDAGRVKAALLEGQWTSAGKPATLLPSDVTLCRDDQTEIDCWSVPRNINTKFGEAMYKVEATIHSFSADGTFGVTYRTLVRLIESADKSQTAATTADEDWQVTEYTTSCRLAFPNRVSCRDQKGVERTYSR